MSNFRTASTMIQEWEESSKRIQTEAEIRAESIRDFAEWYFTKYFRASAEDINNILVEYEKEKKHE